MDVGLAPAGPQGLRAGFRAIWRWLGWGLVSEAGFVLLLPSIVFAGVVFLPAIIFFAVWWLHLLFIHVVEDSDVEPDSPKRSWKERTLLAGALLTSGCILILVPIASAWGLWILVVPRWLTSH
ncbi:MAG: hypothetical protein RL885_28650 [Planctomycetota bacterium]